MSPGAEPRSWLEEHLETTSDTEFFWQSGHDGRLRIQACRDCDYLIHPPAPYCPACAGRAVAPRPVSGRATLHTYTVLGAGFGAGRGAASGDEAPTVVAMVVLEEQADLMLFTNLVGIPVEEIEIGMPLAVRFRVEGALSVPVFGRAETAGGR